MSEQPNDSETSVTHLHNDFKARLRSFHGAEKKWWRGKKFKFAEKDYSCCYIIDDDILVFLTVSMSLHIATKNVYIWPFYTIIQFYLIAEIDFSPYRAFFLTKLFFLLRIINAIHKTSRIDFSCLLNDFMAQFK